MAVKSTASGLAAWLVQRVTALYMLAFILSVSGFLLFYPMHSYAQWTGWIHQPIVSIAGLVFFAALLSHMWVGLRDVLFDYARPAGLRRSLLIVVASALVGLAAWVVWILFVR
ncbi:MAG: succinate dehydrogenase, hydrophobic membrane anchor protein [Rhodoferax sp.]